MTDGTVSYLQDKLKETQKLLDKERQKAKVLHEALSQFLVAHQEAQEVMEVLDE